MKGRAEREREQREDRCFRKTDASPAASLAFSLSFPPPYFAQVRRSLVRLWPPLLEPDSCLCRVEVGLEKQGRRGRNSERVLSSHEDDKEKRATSASRKKREREKNLRPRRRPLSTPHPPKKTFPPPSPPPLPSTPQPDKLAETKKAERAQKDAHKAELAAAKQAKKQAAAADKAMHRDERAAAHAETKRAAAEARAAAKKGVNGDSHNHGNFDACEHGVNHCKICRGHGREKEGKHGGR